MSAIQQAMLGSAMRSLQTVNFFTNDVWVCPAGVTSIEVLAQGGAGTNETIQEFASFGYWGLWSGYVGSGQINRDWSELYTEASNLLTQLNASTSRRVSPVNVPRKTYSLDSYGASDFIGSLYSNYAGEVQSGTYITGTVTLQLVGTARASGIINITDKNNSSEIRLRGDYYIPGSSGPSSSIGGIASFPGGQYNAVTGVCASPSIYPIASLSVTPGNSYTITVAPSGIVQLKYTI